MRKHLSLPALFLALAAAPSAAMLACGASGAAEAAEPQLAAAYPKDKPAAPSAAVAPRGFPVGHFSAPGVERRTATVVLRRDVVVTAAQTFMHDRKWRAPLHSYRFHLGDDGSGSGRSRTYQIGYLILGTGQPDRDPAADWAVVKLTEAVDEGVQPLALRPANARAMAPGRGGLLRLAYFTGANGTSPAFGQCRLTGAAAGAVQHDCATEVEASGAPLIVEEGGRLYLGLLHIDRTRIARRVAGRSPYVGSAAANLGIPVEGDFYRRIVEYASR